MRRVLLLTALLLIAPRTALAGLWDCEVIATEESERFPSIREVIAGDFPQHSDNFYQWRQEERAHRLENEPSNLGWREDQAIAMYRRGRIESAIEVLGGSVEVAPGRYESLASLGTILTRADDVERGMDYLRRAVALRRDAPFRREYYELRAWEYRNSRAEEGVYPTPLGQGGEDTGFQDWLEQAAGEAGVNGREAANAIAAMIRFDAPEDPALHELLGDVLRRDQPALAARAYLRAAQLAAPAEAEPGAGDEDPEEPAEPIDPAVAAERAAAYRALAEAALEPLREMVRAAEEAGDPVPPVPDLARIEEQLTEAQATAQANADRLSAQEIEWLAGESNPEEEFAGRYLGGVTGIAESRRGDEQARQAAAPPLIPFRYRIWVVLGVGSFLAIATAIGLAVRARTRKATWARLAGA